ncbi:MAG: hypothetical protein KatS3mg087_1106 [Patescibacteria group bacterium]|nr:MAG: hypothetical protein KatS3mg087_1106 [Patescibacteria group bacterium]
MPIFDNDSDEKERIGAPSLLSDIGTITSAPFTLFGAGEFDLEKEAENDPSWRFIADTITETYRKAIESPEEAVRDPELLGPYRGFTAALKEYAPFIGVERLPIAAAASLIRLRNDPQYRREAAEGKNRAAELIGLYLADQELRSKEGFLKQVARGVGSSLQIAGEIGVTAAAGALTFGTGGAAGAGAAAGKAVVKEAAEEVLEQAAKRSLKSILGRSVKQAATYTGRVLPKSAPSIARLSEQRLAREFAPTPEETEFGGTTITQRGAGLYTAPKALLYGAGELIPEFAGEGAVSVIGKVGKAALSRAPWVSKIGRAASTLTSRLAATRMLLSKFRRFFEAPSAEEEVLGHRLSRLNWKKFLKSIGITTTEDDGLAFFAKSMLGEWAEERMTDILHGITELDFGLFALLAKGEFGEAAEQQAQELAVLGVLPVAGAAVSKGVVSASDVSKIYLGLGRTPTSQFSHDLSAALSFGVEEEDQLRSRNFSTIFDAALDVVVTASDEDIERLRSLEEPSRSEWENSIGKTIFDRAGIRVLSKHDRQIAARIASSLVDSIYGFDASQSLWRQYVEQEISGLDTSGPVELASFSQRIGAKANELYQQGERLYQEAVQAYRELQDLYRRPTPTHQGVQKSIGELFTEDEQEYATKTLEALRRQLNSIVADVFNALKHLQTLSLNEDEQGIAEYLRRVIQIASEVTNFIESHISTSAESRSKAVFNRFATIVKSVLATYHNILDGHARLLMYTEGLPRRFLSAVLTRLPSDKAAKGEFARAFWNALMTNGRRNTIKERLLAFLDIATFISSRTSRAHSLHAILNDNLRKIEENINTTDPQEQQRNKMRQERVINLFKEIIEGGLTLSPFYYLYGIVLTGEAIKFDENAQKIIVDASKIGDPNVEAVGPATLYQRLKTAALKYSGLSGLRDVNRIIQGELPVSELPWRVSGDVVALAEEAVKPYREKLSAVQPDESRRAEIARRQQELAQMREEAARLHAEVEEKRKVDPERLERERIDSIMRQLMPEYDLLSNATKDKLRVIYAASQRRGEEAVRAAQQRYLPAPEGGILAEAPSGEPQGVPPGQPEAGPSVGPLVQQQLIFPSEQPRPLGLPSPTDLLRPTAEKALRRAIPEYDLLSEDTKQLLVSMYLEGQRPVEQPRGQIVAAPPGRAVEAPVVPQGPEVVPVPQAAPEAIPGASGAILPEAAPSMPPQEEPRPSEPAAATPTARKETEAEEEPVIDIPGLPPTASTEQPPVPTTPPKIESPQPPTPPSPPPPRPKQEGVVSDDDFGLDDILPSDIGRILREFEKQKLQSQEREQEEEDEDLGPEGIWYMTVGQPQGQSGRDIITARPITVGFKKTLISPAGYRAMQDMLIGIAVHTLSRQGRKANDEAGTIQTAIDLDHWWHEYSQEVQIERAARDKILQAYAQLDRFVRALEGQLTVDALNSLGGEEEVSKLSDAYDKIERFRVHEIAWQYGALMSPYAGQITEGLANYINATGAFGTEDSPKTVSPGQWVIEEAVMHSNKAHNEIVYEYEIVDPNYADLWDALYSAQNVIRIEKTIQRALAGEEHRPAFTHIDKEYLAGFASSRSVNEAITLIEGLKERDENGKLKRFFVVGNQFPSFIRVFLSARLFYEEKVKAQQEGREFIARSKVGRAPLGSEVGIGGFIVGHVGSQQDLDRYYWPGRSLGVALDFESYRATEMEEGRSIIVPAKHIYRGKEIYLNRGPAGKTISIDKYRILQDEPVKNVLIDLQKQGVAMMLDALENHSIASLQDGTGTGKTHQLMSIAAEYVRHRKSAALVIAPNGVLESTYDRFRKLKQRKSPASAVLAGVYKDAADMLGLMDETVVVSYPNVLIEDARNKILYEISRDPIGGVMHLWAVSNNYIKIGEYDAFAALVLGRHNTVDTLRDRNSVPILLYSFATGNFSAKERSLIYRKWKEARGRIKPTMFGALEFRLGGSYEASRQYTTEMVQYIFDNKDDVVSRHGEDAKAGMMAEILAKFPESLFIGSQFINQVYSLVGKVLSGEITSRSSVETEKEHEALDRAFFRQQPSLANVFIRLQRSVSILDQDAVREGGNLGDEPKIFLLSYQRMHRLSDIHQLPFADSQRHDLDQIREHGNRDYLEVAGVLLHQALSVFSEQEPLLSLDESQYMKNIGTASRSMALNGMIQYAKHALHVLYVTATPIDSMEHIKYLSFLITRDRRRLMRYLAPWLGIFAGDAEMTKVDDMRKLTSEITAGDVYTQFTHLMDILGRKGIVVSRMLSLAGIEVGWRAIENDDDIVSRLNDLDHLFENIGYDYRTRLMLNQHYIEQYKVQRVVQDVIAEVARGRKVVVYALHTGGGNLINTLAEIGHVTVDFSDDGRLVIAERENLDSLGLSQEEIDEATRARTILDRLTAYPGNVVEPLRVDATQHLLLSQLENAVLPDGRSIGRIAVLVGSTPVKDRSDIIADFRDNEDGAQVLITNINVGGEGISLDDRTGRKPRTMIIMTPPMVATKAVQAVGRIHRLLTVINPEQPTRVYFVYYPQLAIDSALVSILVRKMRLLGAITPGHAERLLHPGLQEIDSLRAIRSRNFYNNPPEGNIVDTSYYRVGFPIGQDGAGFEPFRMGFLQIAFEQIGPNMPLAIVPAAVIKAGNVDILDAYPDALLRSQGDPAHIARYVMAAGQEEAFQTIGHTTLDWTTAAPIVTKEGIVIANNFETSAFYNLLLEAKEAGTLKEFLARYYKGVLEYLPFAVNFKTSRRLIALIREAMNDEMPTMFGKSFFMFAKVMPAPYSSEMLEFISRGLGARHSNPVTPMLARRFAHHARFSNLIEAITKASLSYRSYAGSKPETIIQALAHPEVQKIAREIYYDLVREPSGRQIVTTKDGLTDIGLLILNWAVNGYAYQDYDRYIGVSPPIYLGVSHLLAALGPRLALLRSKIENLMMQYQGNKAAQNLHMLYPGRTILNAAYFAQHAYILNNQDFEVALSTLRSSYPDITPIEEMMAGVIMSNIADKKTTEAFGPISKLIDTIFTEKALENGVTDDYLGYADDTAFRQLNDALPVSCRFSKK